MGWLGIIAGALGMGFVGQFLFAMIGFPEINYIPLWILGGLIGWKYLKW